MYSGNSKFIDWRGLELYLCAKGYTPKVEVLNAALWRIDMDADNLIAEKELQNLLRPMYQNKQPKD